MRNEQAGDHHCWTERREIEHDTQRVLLTIDTVLKRLLKQDAPPHPPTPSPPEEEKGS